MELYRKGDEVCLNEESDFNEEDNPWQIKPDRKAYVKTRFYYNCTYPVSCYPTPNETSNSYKDSDLLPWEEP